VRHRRAADRGPRRDRNAESASFVRVGVVVVLVMAVGLLVIAAPALAASRGGGGGGSFSLPVGLFGISVKGILKAIAKLLFSVLAGAFLPGWLRHAPADALRWLIALPDPADPVQWPTMRALEGDATAVAVAFLPLTFAITVARYTASGVTGGAHHPAESLRKFAGVAVGLLLLPWGFSNTVAAVNVCTSALLSFAAIDHGLQRALALMFAGALAFGVTGPLVALLVIAAILLAVGLLMIKVGVLALFAILYVAGPLALAVSPLPELHGVWRLWLGVLVALALIPIGWCLIFAVAGAISADITHIATPAAIGTRLVGFFAGVLTFFLAFRWPFFLIGMIRARGLLSADLAGVGGGGAGASSAPAGERVRAARAALSAGAATAGSAVSHVGGALGFPAGGLVGAGRRGASAAVGGLGQTPLGLRTQQAVSQGWRTVADRARGSAGSSGGVGGRVAAAAGVAAAAPAAIRAAVAERASPQSARAAGEQILAGARRGNSPGAPTTSPRPSNGGAAANQRRAGGGRERASVALAAAASRPANAGAAPRPAGGAGPDRPAGTPLEARSDAVPKAPAARVDVKWPGRPGAPRKPRPSRGREGS
jgi:hypothetical protein